MIRLIGVASVVFALAGAVSWWPPVAGAQGTFRAVPRAAPPDRCRVHRYCVRRAPGAAPVAGFAQLLVTGPIAPVTRPRSSASRRRGAPSTAGETFMQVTLNNGKGFDAGFATWAASGGAAQAADIFVDELDEAGRHVSTRHFHGCRATTYQGLPDLDASSPQTTIVHLELRCAA